MTQENSLLIAFFKKKFRPFPSSAAKRNLTSVDFRVENAFPRSYSVGYEIGYLEPVSLSTT